MPAQMADADDAVVKNGNKDIATSYMTLSKIEVQAVGRRYHQHVYMYPGDTSGTAMSELHLTSDDITPEDLYKLPTEEELTPDDNLIECLEVGIIIVENWTASASGARGKGKEKSKAEGKVRESGEPAMQRPDNVLHVFVQVSEQIKKRNIYFAGCKRHHGRLYGRIVPKDDVYYYSEFWESVKETYPQRRRQTELTNVIKLAAARDKSSIYRPVITLGDIGVKDAEGPFHNPRGQHWAALATMWMSEYELTGDTKWLELTKAALEHGAPDLKDYPALPDTAACQFFEWEDDIDADTVARMGREMKRAKPGFPDLHVETVLRIRQLLIKEDLHKSIWFGDLEFFLHTCHGYIPAETTDGDMSKTVNLIISVSLPAYREHKSLWSPSSSSTDVPPSLRALQAFHTCIKHIQKHGESIMDAVTEQYGAKLPDRNANALSKRIAGYVDLTSMQAGVEQIGILLAHELSLAPMRLNEELEQLANAVNGLILEHLE